LFHPPTLEAHGRFQLAPVDFGRVTVLLIAGDRAALAADTLVISKWKLY
jgi:hypothetical protein